jgi:hypothetical protein
MHCPRWHMHSSDVGALMCMGDRCLESTSWTSLASRTVMSGPAARAGPSPACCTLSLAVSINRIPHPSDMFRVVLFPHRFPCVGFRNGGENGVTIKNCKWLSRPGEPASAALERVLEVRLRQQVGGMGLMC